ncbi:hypothetical protein VNO80_26566 [Phaseolus coccineus]|uniref:Beta-glucosidase n=1 Tax=Phaseolus coccineus TaxID=3886 RepID=A0AAN9LF88_PHACN
MRTNTPSLLCLLSLAIATIFGSGTATATPSVKPSHYASTFNRTLFPSTFIFGIGSSAYQAEGATNVDGRGASIWDTFTQQHPEKIWDHSTGDVGADFYHCYKSDIKLVKEIGIDSIRFSISWTRIFPKGKGAVNHLGVQFYNDLINQIISNGLIPFVTLFHWDFPQTLEDEYGGFRSHKVVEDFHRYADFCYKTFGDRVKHWVTLNEPLSYSLNGYSDGTFAPGRCSKYAGNCIDGDSATEPYIVGHNLLLAHETAATLYKTKYQARQKGQIGITLPTHYFLPKSNTAADQGAANRALDFFFGWYAHPLIYGDYPESMKCSVGARLAQFTKPQSEGLRKSTDFLGVNYYTTYYAENAAPVITNKTFYTDILANPTTEKNGVPIGTPTILDWLFIYPKGIHHLMLYIRDKYKNPNIYITENGVAEARNDSIAVDEARKDGVRIRYLISHLHFLLQSIKEGVNVKGYYAWSFSDSFEWDAGYTVRFGQIYVDYKNNLKRYLKFSSLWLKKFLLN